ncbi:hypothetical protein B0H13DRAFT_2325972 [Mycena leptocephala]|nr:hypothetical protein B0H13DRAFT_2325972 [Mycena leptocephala]
MALNTNLRTEPGKRIILDRASGNQGLRLPRRGAVNLAHRLWSIRLFGPAWLTGLPPLAEFEFGGAAWAAWAWTKRVLTSFIAAGLSGVGFGGVPRELEVMRHRSFNLL